MLNTKLMAVNVNLNTNLIREQLFVRCHFHDSSWPGSFSYLSIAVVSDGVLKVLALAVHY